MTNERDTARRLRNKLGLDRTTGALGSRKSIVADEKVASTSRSPMQGDMGMGGFRSTHLSQGTSQVMSKEQSEVSVR